MAVGPDGRWEIGISDPTVVGWVTVVAYGVATILALRCARRSPEPLEYKFWAALTVALALLGINKQLDVQSLITQLGRDFAHWQGWYESRRLVQAAFIGFLIAAGLAIGALLAWIARRLPRTTQVAAVGLVLLVVFVVIRGISFHHVDALLRSDIEGMRFNWVLELTPLIVISVSAWRRHAAAGPPAGRRRRRPHRGRSSQPRPT